MCGIVGLFAYRGDHGVDRDELIAIRDHMVSRGPDGEGAWVSSDGRVALGHRRLAIIDLTEGGRQPMASADGTTVLSYNGEIYNYADLRTELETEGHRFRSQSDTEVLLELYRARGERMFDALRGMYAFTLWDAKKGAMLVARDPFGIKPLYVADDGSTLRVASQVKALVAGGRVDGDQDAAAAAGFYLFGSVPEPFTIARGVRALPAGSYRWCDERGLGATRRHFDLAAEMGRARSLGDRVAGPRELIHDAVVDSVRHHMVADVPVGAFLSAGVDSCTLVSRMQDLARSSGAADLRTITLAFDELAGHWVDESPLAGDAARLYGTEHHRRLVTRAEFERDLPGIIAAMDQPSIDGINTWFVSKATRELGLKVAVSGLGGDELFGGYGRTFDWIPQWQPKLAALSRLPGLTTAWRRALRWEPMMTRLQAAPKWAELLALGRDLPGAYLLRRGVFLPDELGEVMGEDRAREGLARLAPFDMIRQVVTPDPGDDYTRIATLESSLYMRNQLLRDSDWASMAHSLELRVPLVDATLWKAVVPALVRERRSSDKRLLAEVATPHLPRDSFARPKTGFFVPVQRWLSEMGDSPVDAWRRIPALRRPRCHWARRLAVGLLNAP